MQAAIVAVSLAALVALCLGTVKVDNELKMTRAYDRQAAALERIADAVEGKIAPKLPAEVPYAGQLPEKCLGSYQEHLKCEVARSSR